MGIPQSRQSVLRKSRHAPSGCRAIAFGPELAPDSVRERINYGLALLRAGQTKPASAELIRAQKQDPSHSAHLVQPRHRLQTCGRLRQSDRTIPRHDPSGARPSRSAHYNLAAVLRVKGRTDEAALPEFLEAEKLNPDLAGPHFQLFTLYQRTGDKEAAARERKLFEEAKKRERGRGCSRRHGVVLLCRTVRSARTPAVGRRRRSAI